MICINKTIYLYETNEDSLMNNRGNSIEIKNRIYLLKMYKEIFLNSYDRKYLCAHIIQSISYLNNTRLLSIIKKEISLKLKIIVTLKSFLKNNFCSHVVIKIIEIFINYL